MTARDPNNLYCKFCDYSVRKFRTNARAKVIQGWVSLKAHIEFAHPVEAERIYGPEDQR